MSAPRTVTHALVLAAGKGTRLRPLTDSCPKPLLDLAGKPILDHILQALADAGIEHVCLVTGHLREMIIEHIGDGERFGLSVTHFHQDPPRGTGHAVHLAAEHLRGHPFLMTFGDIVLSSENCGAMLESQERDPADLLLGVNWMDDPSAGAAVVFDEAGRVSQIVEKPPRGQCPSNWNNAGLMVFGGDIFALTGQLEPSPRGELELTDAIAALIKRGGDVRAHRLEGFWSDIGTPEDLERTRQVWSRGQGSPERASRI